MKEFDGLKVPEGDTMPDGGDYNLQDWECRKIRDYSDCETMRDCNKCIFYQDNIDKFRKWYSQKAL